MTDMIVFLIYLARIACVAAVAYLGGWPAFIAACLFFWGREELFRQTVEEAWHTDTAFGSILWVVCVLLLEAIIWAGFIAYLNGAS